MLDKRLYELGEKFNGPKRWPIIGNAHEFFGISPKGKKMKEVKVENFLPFKKLVSEND